VKAVEETGWMKSEMRARMLGADAFAPASATPSCVKGYVRMVAKTGVPSGSAPLTRSAKRVGVAPTVCEG
jgi:hypothetical protein